MLGLSVGFLLACVVKAIDESGRVLPSPIDAVKSAGQTSGAAGVPAHRA